jgi:sulfur carrier protein ThiS
VPSFYDEFTDYVGSLGSTLGSVYGLLTSPTPPADTSVLLLNGSPVPGIVQSEEIVKELRIEQVPIEDLSGSVKLVHGFADAVLRYGLTLTSDDIDDGLVGDISALLSGDISGAIDGFFGGDAAAPLTAVEKLSALKLFFQQYSTEGDVKVWEISQELATAADVSRVLFRTWQMGRNSSSDKIEVVLEFMEYQPATVLFETGAATPPPPPDAPEPDTTDPFDGLV